MIVKRELTIAIALALVLTVAVAGIKWVRVDEMFGDTAIFLQTTENIAHDGRAVSQVFANTQAFLAGQYGKMTPAQLAKSPLAPPRQDERAVLPFHAYLVLYILAPFTKLIPPSVVLMTADALSFAGMLLLAYLDLRSRRIAIAASAAFCAVIVASPAWAQASLFGQFFPDRLFMLAGLAFMLRFSRSATPRWEQIALGCSCLLVGERGALVAGGFALLYTALYWREAGRERTFKLAAGAVLLLYALVLMRWVLQNPEYATYLPSSMHAVAAHLRNPALLQMTFLYILVYLPLLVFAAFEWRALVIAAVFMLPNIIGTIGGAEKIGWVLHYHSYDFPVLVWAALAGFKRLRSMNAAVRRRAIPYAAAAAAVLYLAMLDPNSYQQVRFSPTNIGDSFFVRFPDEAFEYLSPAGLQYHALVDPLTTAVPAGAVVSTVELGMPALFPGRTIRFFPLGIDQADYAVVADYGPSASPPRYRGMPNFDPSRARAVDEEIVARMRHDGYDFKNAVEVPGLSLAIVRRR